MPTLTRIVSPIATWLAVALETRIWRWFSSFPCPFLLTFFPLSFPFSFDPIPSPEERLISQSSSVFSSVFLFFGLGTDSTNCAGIRSHIIRCSLCARNSRTLGSQLHSDFDLFFIPRLSGKDNRIMVAEQCWQLTRQFLGGYTLVRVGTGLDVFWCGYWNSGYEHRDGLTRPWNELWRISSNSWVLNSKLHRNCGWCWKISKRAQVRERENALQAQLSDMLQSWNRDAADVEERPEVELEQGAPRRQSIHRVSSILQVGKFWLQSGFVEGLGFQVWEHGSSCGPIFERYSWLGSSTGHTNIERWRCRSRSRFCRNQSFKYSLHWQSFWKERHWTLCRTRHEAQVWKLGGNSWEG